MKNIQDRSKLDNWGGVIFMYSGSAQLISFEINGFYGVWTRIYEYHPPPPPNYRACYGPDIDTKYPKILVIIQKLIKNQNKIQKSEVVSITGKRLLSD